MRTVILFGAGASKSAGYPTANELFPEIAEFTGSPSLVGPATDWAIWTKFRDSEVVKPFEALLKVLNPELILSLLDLFSAGQDDAIHSLFSLAQALAKDPNIPSAREAITHFEARLNGELAKAARDAKRALLRCLKEFFIRKSYDEFYNPEKRDYLRKTFSNLQVGDTVITFNWDSTAERTLGEMGLWNPTTGYGFDKGLIRGKVDVPDNGVRELIPSQVRVLKLHGSIGWQRSPLDSEPIFLDNDRLLQYLHIMLPNEKNPVTFVDPDYNRIEHDEVPIIPPTFLKLVPTGKDMQYIWYLASKALAEADRVLVWGYSLPPSDAAARVLLNPLRFRLSERGVEVRVTDPSGDVRNRWNEFLGQEVSTNDTLPSRLQVDS